MVCALLREMSGLSGKATFECVESCFSFNRCSRQGSVEALRLWQKMATQIWANVEEEWIKKRFSLGLGRKSARQTPMNLPAHVRPCFLSQSVLPSEPFLNLTTVLPAKVGIHIRIGSSCASCLPSLTRCHHSLGDLPLATPVQCFSTPSRAFAAASFNAFMAGSPPLLLMNLRIPVC